MSGFMTFAKESMKNLFSKPATINYPAEPINFPEGSRGHITIEVDKCISCGMCVRVCPPGALAIDKIKGTWTINRFDCIACSYCVIKCPVKCLAIEPGYTEPDFKKASETFTKSPEVLAREAAKREEMAKKAAEAKAAALAKAAAAKATAEKAPKAADSQEADKQ